MYVTPAPTISEMISKVVDNGAERLPELLGRGLVEDGRDYVHWDKLRQLEPPGDLSPEEWWLLIKWGRQNVQRAIPLADPSGQHFVYGVPDLVARRLHYVDQRCAGEVAMSEVVTADAQARQHYLVNSFMEEAIRSSQLEGATTTRRVAKELLRTGREPKDRSERMILNNYRALQYMRDEMPAELTPGTVLELQRILTDGTLDDPDAAGRLQRPDEERIAVVDRLDGTVHSRSASRRAASCSPAGALRLRQRRRKSRSFHSPSPAGDPAALLARLRPPIRRWEWTHRQGAVLLVHAYPRLLARRVPVDLSHPPPCPQSRYTRAFVLTETDERDATYFIVYQLEVIQRAVEQLHHYLRQKIKDVRDVETLLKGSDQFNHRQFASTRQRPPRSRCFLHLPLPRSEPRRHSRDSAHRSTKALSRWDSSSSVAKDGDTSFRRPQTRPSA